MKPFILLDQSDEFDFILIDEETRDVMLETNNVTKFEKWCIKHTEYDYSLLPISIYNCIFPPFEALEIYHEHDCEHIETFVFCLN